MRKKVVVNDKMQKNYIYYRTEKPGKNFRRDFKPYYTPNEILRLGAFEGKYMNDCTKEFPKTLFRGAKIVTNLKKNRLIKSPKADPSLNLFKIKSRMSLKQWRKNKWIYGDDPRGAFQWYVRYYYGRRDPPIDDIQIKRWKQIRRHAGQIKASYKKMHKPKTRKQKLTHRPKQRQALLQWYHNPWV